MKSNEKIVQWVYIVLVGLSLLLTVFSAPLSVYSDKNAAPQRSQTGTRADLDGVVEDGEYTNEASFGGGDFTVYWLIEGGNITMAISGKTTGWVTIGFDPSSAMKDADMVFGWVSGGTPDTSDQYSVGTFGPHSPDTSLGGTDDIIDYSGTEAGGVTTMEFKRKLDTGDTYDNIIPSTGTMNIIWALGATDTITVKHVQKGSGTLDMAAPVEDITPPTVEITSPMEGQIVNTESIEVTGTAGDDVGLDEVSVRVNIGQWQIADGTNSWSRQVLLAEGANKIEARVLDTSGNEGTVSVNVTYNLPADSTPPDITISYPEEGDVFYNKDLTVSGTANDENLLDRVEISVNSGSWETATGSQNWSMDITLDPGDNDIRARAFDVSGNQATDTVNVNYNTSGPPDFINPIIDISMPLEGSVFNVDVTTIRGNASDDTGLSVVHVRVNQEAWQLAEGKQIWYAEIALKEGVNTIDARATDSSGNIAVDTVNLTYDIPDTISPVIIIEYPVEGQEFDISTISFRGNVSEEGDLSKLEIRINDGEWTLLKAAGTWDADVSLIEGNNTLYMRATDTSGNSGTRSVNVSYTPPDTSPPEIDIVVPADDSLILVGDITVSGTASDDRSLRLVEVRLNDGDWSAADGLENWDLELHLTEGSNTIRVRASDAAGNTAAASVNVRYEKTASVEMLDGVIGDGEYPFKTSFDDGHYTIYWRIDGDLISMAISARTTGWVAVGFEPSSRMKNADMIIGWVDDSGKTSLLDCFSTGETGPHPPDTTLGGTDDILAFAGTEKNGRTVIEFLRKLETGDSRDRVIFPDGSIDIIWATGDVDDFNKIHGGSRGKGTLALASGESTELDSPTLWPVHAVLMGFGFMILSTGVLIAKTQRNKKWWMKTHRTLGIIGVCSALGGITFAFYMVGSSGGEHFRVLHPYFGAFTAFFLIATPILGKMQFKVKTKKNLVRNFHRWFGRIALVLMVLTILMGLMQAGIL